MTPIWFIHDLVDVLAEGDHSVLEMLAPPGDQPAARGASDAAGRRGAGAQPATAE